MQNTYTGTANEHGVFVNCGHETLTIIETKTCSATIKILNIVDGYIYATSAAVPDAGASVPLTMDSVVYKKKADALRAGINDLCRISFIPPRLKAKIREYTV